MAADDPSVALDLDLQPPMANGEVVFEAPWQSRVFAMAVSLHESGVFAWSEFQAKLIEVIARTDDQAESGDGYAYFDHFAAALQELLATKSLVPDDLLEARIEVLRQRPHGHDH